MNDQEKSLVLARLMGWREVDEYDHMGHLLYRHWVDGGKRLSIVGHDFDLYHPDNMALAWRVHLWATTSAFYDKYRYWLAHGTGYEGHLLWWEKTNAQRAWLDKILELAIEAGMVEGVGDE